MPEIWTADSRNACGFASCFILDQDGPAAQLRSPFQDVKSCSDVHSPVKLEPSFALLIPKISQLHPVATALFEIRGTSGITLLDGPVRRTKPCQRMLTMKIFSRPTEPYMFWAWRNNWYPFEHQSLYLHGIWSYCSHVLTWVYFSKFHLVSVWRFRGAIGANVERKLCVVLFLCFSTRKSLAIDKGLNPRMTSQQPNLLRNWFACFHSVFLSDLANICQREPSACFLHR